jgi:8-amino-7-oxononanoate synthase
MKFAALLKENGLYAPAIRPPTVLQGQCRIRFSLTAEHTDEQLNTLIKLARE